MLKGRSDSQLMDLPVRTLVTCLLLPSNQRGGVCSSPVFQATPPLAARWSSPCSIRLIS